VLFTADLETSKQQTIGFVNRMITADGRYDNTVGITTMTLVHFLFLNLKYQRLLLTFLLLK